ncbi:SusC/RagA family TonB-linked outer membrane protein [uncultured Dysgonomonas sp.]|uniref:TonB-linked outer membrane protein, SusC/RagA family n=1 Tax=uncultured Dysgonomonas sp. TaxID=206096 RepID=A0A212JDN6_9BACT|nr:SusC/RagA family TonB-linked outer membrane protein [uncultured Dysgonomonas sp.]SBV97518.1 TonB-linked outer membrane protein, SusC/RagA family [uncultured Dysgonomonas sp.]
MKRFKIVGLLFLFLLTNSLGLYAQGGMWKLSGTIKDNSGEPMPGATVTVKNSQRGFIADESGNFKIDVAVNETLVINFIGYKTQEILITPTLNNLNVVLEDESRLLEGVTVTALGIKREKKALGYSIGEVQGDELQRAKETNVINSLAGKIPGLVVTQTAGGPSGSTRVVLRGMTELTGNNQPLYVVDGIPLDNTNFADANGSGGFDLGDGISSINPDDIENMSILKGPAAAALYGSRASHGVILITTKKAGKKQGLGVEFNSTTTIEKQLTKYNDLQTSYGQGFNGSFYGEDPSDRTSSNQSWGPKIDPNLHYYYFDGQTRPYELTKNNLDGFFRTGVTTQNTVTINNVKDDNGVRLSYTNLYNRDIVPNTNMKRNSINLRGNTKIASKVDVDAKITYVREDVKNRPALAGDSYNAAKNLITLPTTFNQAWLKNYYQDENGNYGDWNSRNPYALNPYWMLYAMENNSTKDKFSGMASLNYAINNKFSVRLTGGTDLNFMNFREFAPMTTPGRETGYMQEMDFKNKSYNVEALAFYKDKFGKFDFGANVGSNIFYVDNKTSLITAQNMVDRTVQSWKNFTSIEVDEIPYEKQINSLMAMANVGYNGFLYLDATMRMDYSSTLPAGNRTYVYPSVSTSFVFSEVWNVNKDIIPYAKVRASFAQVSSDTDPYQLQLQYKMSSKSYGSMGAGSISNTVIPNKDLKPTRTNSFEIGLDMRFLKNRLGFDFTYYSQRSHDQILSMTTSTSTGYAGAWINAGKVDNKGVEIVLNGRPVETKDFSWDVSVNFSKNINKIIELHPDVKSQELSRAGWLDVVVEAREGEKYGSITGLTLQRNENGDVIIDPNTGLPLKSTNRSVIGNASWDWTGGLTTSLRYRKLALSAIFDVKVGADLFSLTARDLVRSGKHKSTIEGRDAWYESEEKRKAAGKHTNDWEPTGGFVAPGVVETTNADGTKSYTANTKIIDPQVYWQHISDNDPEQFVYDNSYVKLRELTLTYDLPKQWINKFAQDVSVSFVARNPFIIWKNIDNIDPDSNYNNSTSLGLEWGSMPSRRSFGLNVNIKF